MHNRIRKTKASDSGRDARVNGSNKAAKANGTFRDTVRVVHYVETCSSAHRASDNGSNRAGRVRISSRAAGANGSN